MPEWSTPDPGDTFVREVSRLTVERSDYRSASLQLSIVDATPEARGGPARIRRSPDLVTATDLDSWAAFRDAQHLFPELTRRLLAATRGVTELSMRSGEGVHLPGWDGQVFAEEASPWAPAGASYWELGTGSKPRDKASSTYGKRTAEPLGANPREATFVFATPRRWAGKEAWLLERRAEAHWKDVRALDADDFEGWLQAEPAVHVWLSEVLGHQPQQVGTLATWWDLFSNQTRPPCQVRCRSRDVPRAPRS